MKFNSIYNSFSSGELSRNLKGRTDLEEYFKGVDEMTNFIPTKQGGASFRTGTIINLISTYLVTASKVVDFSPRDDERYTVIIQPGRVFRIINNATGALATIGSNNYIWNERPDFTLSANAYVDPSDTDAHRLIVDSLQEASSGDVMVIVDGTGRFAPISLLRIGADSFVVDSLISPAWPKTSGGIWAFPPSLPLRVPYRDSNVDIDIRLVPSATSGTITITSQNAAAASIPFFQGDVIGMWIKINHSGTTGVAKITAQASTSSVTALVYVNFGATTAATDFTTSHWNPNDGYPRSVCFFDGRLIFGGNKNFPDMMWCSHTGNIYHFMQTRLLQDATTNVSLLNYFGTVKVTDPFNFVPAAVGANNIQWVHASDSLLVGTTGNEFSITGGQETTISVGSIFVKAISSHGSSKVQPVKSGSSLFFVSTDGKRVLEIPKRLVEYVSATDVTGLASGIVEKSIESITSTLNTCSPIKSRIRKLTWDESSGVMWCVCKNTTSGDTALVSLTLDKTSKVIAWAKHKISGSPFIASVCSSPDSANVGSSRVFITCQRPGAAYYSLESFSYKTNHDAYVPSQVFPTIGGPLTIYLDGAYFIQTTPANTTDLTFYSSQLYAFPSGATYGVFELTNGVATYMGSFVEAASKLVLPLVDPTKTYIAGALYDGEIKTMPTESGAQFGVAQGSARRVHEISIFVDRSLGGVYKASQSANQFSIVGTKGTTSALYTGEVKLSLNASPHDHQIVIKQTEPYPLNVLWLLTKGYTYDA